MLHVPSITPELKKQRDTLRQIRERLTAHAQKNDPGINLSHPKGVTGTELIRQEAERVRLAQETRRRKRAEDGRLPLKEPHHFRRRQPPHPSEEFSSAVLLIQKAVLRHFPEMSLDDFSVREAKGEKDPEKILMRQVGMFLGKMLHPKASNEYIGICFDRIGADVIHAVRMIPKKMESNPRVRWIVDELKREFEKELALAQ